MGKHEDFVEYCNDEVLGGYGDRLASQPWRILFCPFIILFLVLYGVYLLFYGLMRIILFIQNDFMDLANNGFAKFLLGVLWFPLYLLSIMFSLEVYLCLWIFMPLGFVVQLIT